MPKEIKKAAKKTVKKTVKIKPNKEKKPVIVAGENEEGETVAADKKIHLRGKRYLAAKKQVNSEKLYSLDEALKLLTQISYSRFNGSIEAHFLLKETGLHGEVELPHPTGKTLTIAIANEDTLKKIDNGQIEFNILLATPAQMPKLVKYARVLGPRGLMPNPKNGTVVADPDKAMRELANKTKYKTELKAPLLHLVIGKVKDQTADLKANFIALIGAIDKNNILKATLTPTMGPGIKIDLSQL